MEQGYLVMKLGNIKGVDFYKEHLKVIEEYGYVDLARAGRRFLDFSRLAKPYFYIKESVSGGNRIFQVFIAKDLSGDKRVPEYYSMLDLNNASWVRITNIEIVDGDKFLSEHTLKNGNEIKALNKGAVSYFYIVNKKED